MWETDSWTKHLVCDKNTYTETINRTTETPEVDRHMLHLWEARHGLIKRWKRQKLNRKLKKRIAAITVEALEAYPIECSRAYQRNAAAICVVDGTGSTRITASLRTSNTTIAEEFAIAMAIGLEEDHVTILSDSQAALRRFLAGRVSPKALKVLTQRDRQGFPTVELIWIPEHDEVKGNRCADTEARACSLRAAPAAASRLGIDSYFIPAPNRYSEIRAYHRGQRREYPPPHKNLNREDAVAWRQLQTGAFRNLALLHKFSPTSYKAECPHCG
ncbi:hypothetical protein HPB47_000443 [Ixodes persulcatus]|uniref:Uncharacterized protein n=1 Tax=Ixodes persulcatus TaxID=34615 RepID=A0AC60PRQ8_IXOPE|nr:hypothetical protein HPB47_000443 [Ixodes persulcatus]